MACGSWQSLSTAGGACTSAHARVCVRVPACNLSVFEAAQTRPEGGPVAEDEARAVVDRLDQDGDSVLSIDEFFNGFPLVSTAPLPSSAPNGAS